MPYVLHNNLSRTGHFARRDAHERWHREYLERLARQHADHTGLSLPVLAAEGLHAAAIAKRLRRNHSVVARRARSLGIELARERRRWRYGTGRGHGYRPVIRRSPHGHRLSQSAWAVLVETGTHDNGEYSH